jgi:hypothetical protein
MTSAGVLGFAPITLILAFTLLGVESAVAEAVEAVLPVHRLFTTFFILCAFLIAAICTGSVLRGPAGARRAAVQVGSGICGGLPGGESGDGGRRPGGWEHFWRQNEPRC